MRKPKITEWRLISQAAWLLVLSSVLFGVPYFSTMPLTKNIFWPNLSTRYIVNNPTPCVLYQIQSLLASGYETYYVNLIIPFFIFVLMVIILGRVWCGWLCPIGFLQDILSRIRKRLNISYWDLSPKAVIFLNQTGYVMLFIISFISISIGVIFLGMNNFFTRSELPFEIVAPARPIAIFLQQLIGLESWDVAVPLPGIIIAIIIIVISFKIRHFWCRICPAGALMSLFNRRALINIKKDGPKCTKCRVCIRSCPMDIEEIYEEKEKDNVTNGTCIHCYRCVELCPEDGCLSVTFLNKAIVKSKFPNAPRTKEMAE